MRILEILLVLQKDVGALERGCDCEYDHRCGRCSRIVKVKETLKSLSPEERAADLEIVAAIEDILPKTPASRALVEQLRALANAEVA